MGRAADHGFERLVEASANLRAILAAIAEDGQRELAAVDADLARQFAVRLDAIRRFTPRHLLGAALRALREEQAAARLAAKRRVQMEIRGRKAAARRQRRGGSPHPAPG